MNFRKREKILKEVFRYHNHRVTGRILSSQGAAQERYFPLQKRAE
jgi:hypothetical protein